MKAGWAAGPIAGSLFTDEESAKIRFSSFATQQALPWYWVYGFCLMIYSRLMDVIRTGSGKY